MQRLVRKVPPGWEHPKSADGKFIPLYDGAHFPQELKEWERGNEQWLRGFKGDDKEGWKPKDGTEGCESFDEWAGDRPKPEQYTPVWEPSEATMYMMYESVTEGTPISPAFETVEQLARWLADTGASAWGDVGATYEDWIGEIKRPSNSFAVSGSAEVFERLVN